MADVVEYSDRPRGIANETTKLEQQWGAALVAMRTNIARDLRSEIKQEMAIVLTDMRAQMQLEFQGQARAQESAEMELAKARVKEVESTLAGAHKIISSLKGKSAGLKGILAAVITSALGISAAIVEFYEDVVQEVVEASTAATSTAVVAATTASTVVPIEERVGEIEKKLDRLKHDQDIVLADMRTWLDAQPKPKLKKAAIK